MRKSSTRTPSIVKGNKSLNLIWSTLVLVMESSSMCCTSPIGRVASQPMRKLGTFPSKQVYLFLSLVKRKVAELEIEGAIWFG